MTTATTKPQGTSDENRPNVRRRWRRAPIWLRVSLATAGVLAGVLVGTMVLAGSGIDRRDTGGGHRPGGQTELTDRDRSGGDHGSGGDHASRADHTSRGDHDSGGDHGSRGERSPGDSP